MAKAVWSCWTSFHQTTSFRLPISGPFFGAKAKSGWLQAVYYSIMVSHCLHLLPSRWVVRDIQRYFFFEFLAEGIRIKSLHGPNHVRCDSARRAMVFQLRTPWSGRRTIRTDRNPKRVFLQFLGCNAGDPGNQWPQRSDQVKKVCGFHHDIWVYYHHRDEGTYSKHGLYSIIPGMFWNHLHVQEAEEILIHLLAKLIHDSVDPDNIHSGHLEGLSTEVVRSKKFYGCGETMVIDRTLRCYSVVNLGSNEWLKLSCMDFIGRNGNRTKQRFFPASICWQLPCCLCETNINDSVCVFMRSLWRELSPWNGGKTKLAYLSSVLRYLFEYFLQPFQGWRILPFPQLCDFLMIPEILRLVENQWNSSSMRTWKPAWLCAALLLSTRLGLRVWSWKFAYLLPNCDWSSSRRISSAEFIFLNGWKAGLRNPLWQRSPLSFIAMSNLYFQSKSNLRCRFGRRISSQSHLSRFECFWYRYLKVYSPSIKVFVKKMLVAQAQGANLCVGNTKYLQSRYPVCSGRGDTVVGGMV